MMSSSSLACSMKRILLYRCIGADHVNKSFLGTLSIRAVTNKISLPSAPRYNCFIAIAAIAADIKTVIDTVITAFERTDDVKKVPYLVSISKFRLF